LALANVKPEELEENKSLKDLKEGIEMTQSELGRAFDRNNILIGKIFKF